MFVALPNVGTDTAAPLFFIFLLISARWGCGQSPRVVGVEAAGSGAFMSVQVQLLGMVYLIRFPIPELSLPPSPCTPGAWQAVHSPCPFAQDVALGS